MIVIPSILNRIEYKKASSTQNDNKISHDFLPNVKMTQWTNMGRTFTKKSSFLIPTIYLSIRMYPSIRKYSQAQCVRTVST